MLVEVEQVSAEAGGVCHQLRKLYKKKPSLTNEETAALILTSTQSYSESSEPELRSLLDAAKSLNVTARLSESIFLPNRSVEVRMTNGLEEVLVAFNQPEPSSDGTAYSGDLSVSQPEVAAWVDQLLEVLNLP